MTSLPTEANPPTRGEALHPDIVAVLPTLGSLEEIYRLGEYMGAIRMAIHAGQDFSRHEAVRRVDISLRGVYDSRHNYDYPVSRVEYNRVTSALNARIVDLKARFDKPKAEIPFKWGKAPAPVTHILHSGSVTFKIQNPSKEQVQDINSWLESMIGPEVTSLSKAEQVAKISGRDPAWLGAKSASASVSLNVAGEDSFYDLGGGEKHRFQFFYQWTVRSSTIAMLKISRPDLFQNQEML